MAVLASYGADGKLDVNQLKSNLEKVEGITKPIPTITEGLKNGITVVVDGYKVIIYEEGKVTVENKTEGEETQTSNWTQIGTSITNGEITLEVGDELEYNHLEGIDTSDSNTISYTSSQEANGYGNQEFNITNYIGGWKVLGAEDGKLLITTAESIQTTSGSKYYLQGQNGYVNGEEELDKIGSKYGQGKYADGGRSIKLEDIDRVTGYNPNNIGVQDYDRSGIGAKQGNSICEYGNEVTYRIIGGKVVYEGTNGSSGLRDTTTFIYYDENTKQWKNLQEGESKKIDSYYEWYYPETLTANEDSTAKVGIGRNTKAYDLLFSDSVTQDRYWIASRGDFPYNGVAHVVLHFQEDGRVMDFSIFSSEGDVREKDLGVRPVIYLKSEVKTTKNGNKWVLS